MRAFVGRLGQGITVAGLRRPSIQGDAAVEDLSADLPAALCLSDHPDLLPPLALLAALRPGKTTRFTGIGFLRGKESDRLRAVASVLYALGGCATEEEDSLTVTGVEMLRGGTVDSFGDHRIAMLCACAAPFCRGAVELTGASCVDKSYPAFWADYRALGGRTEVL